MVLILCRVSKRYSPTSSGYPQPPILNTHTLPSLATTSHQGGCGRCPPLGWPPRYITERVSDGGRPSIGLTNTLALRWPLRSRALYCGRTHTDKQTERDAARSSFVVSELERVLPGGRSGEVDRVKMSISPSVCLTLESVQRRVCVCQ